MRLLVVLASILIAASSAAMAETPRQRVMNIPLDMPLDEPLDGEFLEGIYQEKLQDVLKDSVLIETPIQHINSHFTEGRVLELWFSSKEDGRRVFWAHLTQVLEQGREITPETALANFEATYGKADRTFESKSGDGGFWLLIRLDPQLPEERRAAILRQLDAGMPNADAFSISDFAFMDMRDRVKLIGPDFRGAIYSFGAFKGKVAGLQTELLDMVRAHSVLNLTVP